MPWYNYLCETCTLSDAVEEVEEDGVLHLETKIEKKVQIDFRKDGAQPLVWEERHSIFDDPEISCPCCGVVCKKTMIGVEVVSYVRGDGYLDKQGCTRDMNLYKLMKEDPYGHMRQAGEKDDLAQKLRNAGKIGYDRHGNRKTSYFGFGKGNQGGGKIT